MLKSRLRSSCASSLLPIVLCSFAAAQDLNPGHKKLLANSLRLERRLTDGQRRQLSAATQNRFAFARQILEINPTLKNFHPVPAAATQSPHHVHRPNDDRIQMVPISSPAFDYALSRGGGFSQSDTSTAWCGRNIVTGYNDSSAVLMTLYAANGGLSFSGVAHSEDGGKTFTDLGYLDPGPSTFNFLVGNPSVACANERRFYYASMFATTVQSRTQLIPKEAIGVNISNDGGRTWSTPIPAVLMDSQHVLERESLAIDPSNPQRLFLTFTDLDFEVATGGPCAGQTEMLIQMVRSTDGGESWSRAQILKRICANTGNAVNGSRVAVGPDGTVYVTYLFYDNINNRELIQVRRSDDHGLSFHSAVDATTVVPAGANSMLQGLFLSNEYPSIAIDRAEGESRGSIYLAWTDGRNHSQTDLFSATGVYSFGDVLLAKSVDEGRHWSTPIAVSPVPNDVTRDQFMPWVAVDSSGKVAVCYSDRRNSTQNNAIDHYCSVSKDHGSTFRDVRLTDRNWSTGHSNDTVLQPYYMETYDAVTPDWTGHNAGFFSAFQFQNYGDPNAYGAKFFHEED